MGVYIKGLTLPDNCIDCFVEGHACELWMKDGINPHEVRHPDCPIVPAADVRPVVRGQWKLDSDPGEPWRYVCNICGEKTKDTVMGKPRANYCPNCGAEMEES